MSSEAVPLATLAALLLACSTTAGTPPPWYPETNPRGDTVAAVFESRIPCDDCEKIKFAIALYRDQATDEPSTYLMARVYVARSDERLLNHGTWAVARGMALDSQALVYRLDPSSPAEFRAFWAIGQDILFILDDSLRPRVGDGGYSFALSRVR
jgi:hypothetical protein